MSERVLLYGAGKIGAFTVSLGDGETVRCRVEPVGAAGQLRWIIDRRDVRHVGPPYVPLTYLHELTALVAEWWTVKKALGQDTLI